MGKADGRRASGMAIGAASVGVAMSVVGVSATQPAAFVDLAALIVLGSSTHPDGSGNEAFFRGKFNNPTYTGVNGADGSDIVHVNFLAGPAGINQALQANAGEPNAILASGWGAANASLLLRQLSAQNDPVLKQTVFILDNDVAIPNGGFGTRYPWFALIGVNPLPTPTDTIAAAVVDIAYQYDYNSNAPADVWNVLAAVNSLVGYLYRHLNQNEIDLPVTLDGSPDVTCGTANTCGVTDNNVVLKCPDAQCEPVPAGDRVAAYVTQRGKTTYVTYTTKELPLTRLIRDVVPVVGNFIADLTGPLLTTLVNSAYPNGQPIPADPSKYQPARIAPPLNEIVATAAKIPGAIQQGVTAVTGGGWRPSATVTNSRTTEMDETVEDQERTRAVDEKPKLRSNIVRNSVKAVPGTTGLETSPTKGPESVEAVDHSTTPEDTEPPAAQENASNESGQTGTASTISQTTQHEAGKAAPAA
ncbi:PE-PPE domain-containing protein [Mycobacterium sp. URHB0021]